MRVIKPLFLSILLLISTPLVSLPDENSVCGEIESGQLTIPSYRFNVVDKNGNHLANLTARGELEIVEGVWQGGLIDGRWEDKHHDISLSVSYDPKQDQYVSRELPKVKIERRKKGLAPFKTKCWDRVTRLTFTFYRPEAEGASKSYGHENFVFNFPNKKVNETGLPDPGVPIKIEHR